MADHAQLVFISLTNILLVTSLISLLSNSLSKVRPCLSLEPLAQISLFPQRGACRCKPSSTAKYITRSIASVPQGPEARALPQSPISFSVSLRGPATCDSPHSSTFQPYSISHPPFTCRLMTSTHFVHSHVWLIETGLTVIDLGART